MTERPEQARAALTPADEGAARTLSPTSRRTSTRAQLMAAAVAEFGMSEASTAVTVADVVAHTDIGESAVFHHFASVDDLLLAVIDELFAGFDERFAGGDVDGGCTAWVQSAVGRQVRWAGDAPDEARLLATLTTASPRGRTIMTAVHDHLQTSTVLLARKLERAFADRAQLEAEMVARALISLVVEVANSAYLSQSEPRQTFDDLAAAASVIAQRVVGPATDYSQTPASLRPGQLAADLDERGHDAAAVGRATD